MPIAEGLKSHIEAAKQVRTDYGLTEDKVKCAPGLDRALSNFDAFLPTSNNGAHHDVTLVTDGPLQGRRTALFPNCLRRCWVGVTFQIKLSVSS